MIMYHGNLIQIQSWPFRMIAPNYYVKKMGEVGGYIALQVSFRLPVRPFVKLFDMSGNRW